MIYVLGILVTGRRQSLNLEQPRAWAQVEIDGGCEQRSCERTSEPKTPSTATNNNNASVYPARDREGGQSAPMS